MVNDELSLLNAQLESLRSHQGHEISPASPESPPTSTSDTFSNYEASVQLASFLTDIEVFLFSNPADYKELLAQLAQWVSRLNLNKSDFMTKIRSIKTVKVSLQTL